MKNRVGTKEAIVFSFLFFLLFFMDFFIKKIIYINLSYQEEIILNRFFNITYYQNKGASFSFLSEQGGWQIPFFICYAILTSIFCLYLIIKKKVEFKQRISLIILLAGLFGNLYDRVVYGFVIDYLHFHYNDYSFPIFNLADILIFIGIVSFSCFYLKNEWLNVRIKKTKKGI